MNPRTLPALVAVAILLSSVTGCSGDSSTSLAPAPSAASPPADAADPDEGPRTRHSLEEVLLGTDDLPAGFSRLAASPRDPAASALCPGLQFDGAVDRAESHFMWQETGQEVVVEIVSYPSAAEAERSAQGLQKQLITCLTQAATEGGAQVTDGAVSGVGDDGFSARLTHPELTLDVRGTRVGDLVVGVAVKWLDGPEPVLVDTLLADQVARVTDGS